MRPISIALSVLLVLSLALLCVAPEGRSGDTGHPRVGLVFDVGGLGDKSFNDGAYMGLLAARRDLGVGTVYLEPGEGSDREAGLRMLAAEGVDLILGVGFMFTGDLNRVAAAYPGTWFSGIDYALQLDATGQPIPPPPNVLALKFKEEEGSYLVGALAALVSSTGTIGFVGGMDIPLIHKFEAGYRAGALHVRPDCTVLAAYAGVTPLAFKDPARGKELALSQYDRGADVIFHASGSTGLGVFEAARERKKLAIGVDSDQHDEAPGTLLTSMVKRVDRAVLESARAVKAGKFVGGVQILGLKEGGVDYVYDERNKHLIPNQVRARVEAIRTAITSGEIQVPVK